MQGETHWRARGEACRDAPEYACKCLLHALEELGYVNERLVAEGERIVERLCRVV